MEVKIEKGPDGKWVLEDHKQADILFEAIINSYPEDKLKEVSRCPVCSKRTSFKLQKYMVTRHMVEVLFEMRRTMLSDPGQHGFVFMREEDYSVKLDEMSYSMTNGSQQNHKMAWLGLITPLTHDLNDCNPDYHGPDRKRSAYKITQKGLDLLYGKEISPFQVHRRCGKTVVTDEDKKSIGTVLNAKKMTADDYATMCRNAQITPLLVPAGDDGNER